MQELQLNIHGAHKGDCKKPEETFTEGRRNTRFCFINGNMVENVLYIQPLNRAQMNRCSIWNSLVFV